LSKPSPGSVGSKLVHWIVRMTVRMSKEFQGELQSARGTRPFCLRRRSVYGSFSPTTVSGFRWLRGVRWLRVRDRQFDIVSHASDSKAKIALHTDGEDQRDGHSTDQILQSCAVIIFKMFLACGRHGRPASIEAYAKACWAAWRCYVVPLFWTNSDRKRRSGTLPSW